MLTTLAENFSFVILSIQNNSTVFLQDLEFHGVVRFYFQDDKNKVVTKCIRVSSKTTVAMLMDTLVEKFCPDLKMLTHSNYELFECHEKGGKFVTFED